MVSPTGVSGAHGFPRRLAPALNFIAQLAVGLVGKRFGGSGLPVKPARFSGVSGMSQKTPEAVKVRFRAVRQSLLAANHGRNWHKA
jgi:hypothetical protein